MKKQTMAYSECKIGQSIILEQVDGISWISLNNPEKKNALSKEMITELLGTLKIIAEDESQRLIVLKGAGGVFCSGADLDWMRSGINQTMQENMDDAGLFYKLYTKLYRFPKPVIVWVERFAFGGATGLVACADYAIANKDALFAYPEVKLGLVPGTIAPFILKKTGQAQTRAYMLTGETFSAKKAYKSGLINEVCKPEQAGERIAELAKKLINNGPEAITTTKHLIHKIVDEGEKIDDLKKLCCQSIASARISSEGQEGVKAFFEKRPAKWIKPTQ